MKQTKDDRHSRAAKVMKAHRLVDELIGLDDKGIPCYCLDKDGKECNHWSGTKEDMEVCLGRGLYDEEVTLLSLSRCFGPSPVLSDEEWKVLLEWLWPDGNRFGLRKEWRDILTEL